MWIPMLLALTSLQAAAAPEPGRAAPSQEERPAKDRLIAEGLRLYRHRRFHDARRVFQEAVEADPSDAAAHFYLGYTLYKIAEPTRRLTPEKVEAKEQFARCFELDRSFRPTWSR